MPTIPEIKAELKTLGIKGTTGKNKAELMAMLESAKGSVPKRKRPQVAPAPAPVPALAPEAPKRKRPQVAPVVSIIPKKASDEIIEELDDIVKKMKELGKFVPGKRYKDVSGRWPGKAPYLKKIDNLWDKYVKTNGGVDRFFGKIYGIGWTPSKHVSKESEESRRFRQYGFQID